MSPSTAHRGRSWWISAVVGLAVLASGIRAQPLPPDQTGGGGDPVNAMCPVMTDEPIDPRFTSTYQGQSVGLCCRKCLTTFRADPDQYIANIPELRTVAMNEPDDPHTGTAHADGHAENAQSIAPEVARTEEVRPEDAKEPPTDHDPGARWIEWIGKLHVPMTHLPIGMLIGAIIAELGVIVTGRAFFRHAAGFCVIVAALSAVVAATLGWFNGGWVLWDEDWAQAIHRWLGSVTAGLTLLTLAAFAASQRPTHATHAVRRYRALLFLSGILVAATGFFGGALVYGIDHYAW